MSFGIIAEFPLGAYGGHRADGTPELLPDPARLHAALLHSAAQGSRAMIGDDGALRPRPRDLAALEWIESHPPVGIHEPDAMPVATSSITAFRKEGVLRREGGAWKDKTTRRSLSDRTAVNGPVGWIWDNAPADVQESLEALLPDVGCLGEADSPVILRASDVEPTLVLDPTATTFTPGRYDVRVCRPGRTAELIEAHRRANARPPSPSQDKHKSNEQPWPSDVVNRLLSTARYRAPVQPSPDAPWDQVLILPIQRSSRPGQDHVPWRHRVGWCVPMHRALIALIGTGASPMVTGVYPSGERRPENRLAIHYLDASLLTHFDGLDAGAFALLLPRHAEAHELAQLQMALAKLSRIRWSGHALPLRTKEIKIVPGGRFWRKPMSGTIRVWNTFPAAVPETRPQRRNGTPWSLADAATLSVGMVWRDALAEAAQKLRSTARYEAIRAAAHDRGVRVLSANAIPESTARHYVHRTPDHLVVQPYRAQLRLGDLANDQALVAIGQSRHLGGGLLVPVDHPVALVEEGGPW